MRLPSPYLKSNPSTEINLTPMIDMVFLLMVYFVVTYGGAVAEQRLPSAVTAAPSGAAGTAANSLPRPEIAPVVVRVGWNGAAPEWKIDGQPIASLADVRETLFAVAAVKRDVPVVIHPDSPVPLGHVIDLYDQARLAGFEKVQFTAAE